MYSTYANNAKPSKRTFSRRLLPSPPHGPSRDNRSTREGADDGAPSEEVRRELKSRAAYVNREYHSDIDDLRVISALTKRATSNRRPRFEARQTNESKYSLR